MVARPGATAKDSLVDSWPNTFTVPPLVVIERGASILSLSVTKTTAQLAVAPRMPFFQRRLCLCVLSVNGRNHCTVSI